MSENIVTRWFGPHFADLHPLLQDLHRHGGRLSGTIAIGFGRGPAAWLGRRLARKLGLPVDQAQCGFTVDIRHGEAGLHWDRRFADGKTMKSCFMPVGTWPSGHWEERTGFLKLKLTVDVIEGGWHWRPLAVSIAGWPWPLWLFPRSHAYKRVEDGKYRFSVSFSLPLLGQILSYGGLLDCVPDTDLPPIEEMQH